jgi:hypothetical protein
MLGHPLPITLPEEALLHSLFGHVVTSCS